MVVGFVLAVAGAYYLVRYLSGSREAAAVAGVLFGFCPFIFARTAHIQLLLTAGLPFAMLAFHRLLDRPTLGRALALGAILFAQALSCAYYGIFAGLMVGLATLFFSVTRGLWRSPRYWLLIGVAAAVAVGLTLPFFLPYTHVQDQGLGRTLDDARVYSANGTAWLASSAWAHRWWLDAIEGFSEVLFPGVLTLVAGVAGAWSVWRAPAGASPPPGLARDVAGFYALLAVLAFWASLGPDAGLYSGAVRDDSRVRAAARAGPDGDHRDAGAGRPVGRGAGTVAARARPSPRVGRRAGRAGGARAEHGAAHRAARGSAGARGLSHAGPAAARPRGGVPVLHASGPTSPATPNTCWAPPSTGSRW